MDSTAVYFYTSLAILLSDIAWGRTKNTTRTAQIEGGVFDSACNYTSRRFDEWANFSNARFKLWANFSDVHFQAPAIFTAAEYDSVADYSYARFYSWAYFYDAGFLSLANLSHTNFDSLAYFSNARFRSVADFYKSNFSSWADFSNSTFDEWSDFSNSHFVSLAYFYNVRYRTWADFSNARFDSMVNFRYAHFDSLADFSNAHFASMVDFQFAHFRNTLLIRDLTVGKKVKFNFNNAVLPDTIDFSNNPDISLEMASTIDLTLADSLQPRRPLIKPGWPGQFWQYIQWYLYPWSNQHDGTKRHLVNLYNTDISRIKIDYNHFRLFFRSVPINDSTTKELSGDIKESIYEQLLNNFRVRGQWDSYEKLDIEFQWFKGRNDPFLTALNDWWWRFGYEKWRIFIHIIFFILVYSLVNFFLMNKLNDRASGVCPIDQVPEFLKFRHSENTPYRLLRRAWFSIIYTSSIFFLLTLRIEKIKFSKPLSLWIMTIYTTGLVCMGFIANLLLQK